MSDLEDFTRKIYSKKITESFESINKFMPIYVVRIDISKLRKLWNKLTFRKYKNYKVEEREYKILDFGKLIIKKKGYKYATTIKNL